MGCLYEFRQYLGNVFPFGDQVDLYEVLQLWPA